MLYESLIIVPAPFVHLKVRNIFLQGIAGITILSGVFLAVFVHIYVTIHQWILFRLLNMLHIPLREYLALDRLDLPTLTWMQQFSCVYCEYANALAAWNRDYIDTINEKLIAIKADGTWNHLYTRVVFLWFIIDWIALAIIIFLWMFFYQLIYFTIFDIPKSSLLQMFHAAAPQNPPKGVLPWESAYLRISGPFHAWAKEIVNRTELYSCAIKHRIRKRGQEHQEIFAPYDAFASSTLP